MEIITNSAEETQEFAKSFAKTLSPCIICLSGDLGAGKTTFTKGFAQGLGISEIVTSPTFTIMNEYCFKKNKLFHFDMYRLQSADEAYELGFDEIFANKENFCIVEWAENVPGLIKPPYKNIIIEKIDEFKRKIVIKDILWKF